MFLAILALLQVVVNCRLSSPVFEDTSLWADDQIITDGTSSCSNESLSVNIWPLPQYETHGTTKIVVSATNFQFKTISHEHPINTLEQAYKRYYSLIFPHAQSQRQNNTSSSLTLLNISIKDPSEAHMQLNTDESYVLDISTRNGTSSPAASLSANTIYGALRGLETFSQLVSFDFISETYVIANTPWHIQDFPRFQHRGIMIDTSRHFIPISHIKSLIDSVVYAKINVLHWHIIDDPSFPMQSFSHPRLWNGAFSPSERYLQSDIASVVEYSRLRGLRTVVEVDMPGHSSSWCSGYPELCPSSSCKTPLDISKDASLFETISKLLLELTGGKNGKGLFPDSMLHLGGDEVNYTCWDSTPHIQEWLRLRNFTSDDAYKYFVDRVGEIAREQERRPVQWVEVFEHFKNKLHRSTIIHIWKGKKALQEVVKAGYDAILSDQASLYLDHTNHPWNLMYSDEPLEGITKEEQQRRVLGGQAEMWGETVDGSDLQNTVWPRTAAFAERMWSARETRSIPCASLRLKWYRCLLLRRNVAAAPVSNLNARNAPPGPGSCFI